MNQADDDSLFGVVFSHRPKQQSLEGRQVKARCVHCGTDKPELPCHALDAETIATSRLNANEHSHADEGTPCDTVQSDAPVGRSRAIPACRRCCGRPAWRGGHRTLHPVGDPGHWNTDRAVRAIAVVGRRVVLTRRGS